VSDFLHADYVPSLHKAADCWVNLSRGEGWDMGAIQSMACGVPVVAAANTAHLDYIDDTNGYPVKCTKLAITNKEFLARTPNFIDSSWWEADIKDARAKMRQAYNDSKTGKLQEKGKLARESVNGLTWKKTASQIIFNLGKYYN
jgi:glycosyltransferase involved in cell wall biosynthesis